MRILSKESFSTIQPLMPDNYANLHSRMSLQLPPDIAACFAKFTMLTAHNSGQWSIDCEGEDEFKPISTATPPQRMAASDSLARLTEALSRRNIVSNPKMLLSVPDESCIFFRQLPSGDVDIVITQWGYRKIGNASSVNNISLLINGPDDGRERTDVNLRLQWSDGMPLADTNLKVGIYGSAFEKKSDAEGIVHLGTVASGERFTVDVEGQQTVALHTDSSSREYLVTFPWKVDARITCVDSTDKPLKLTINVDGRPVQTDEDGICEIKDITLEKEGALKVDFQGHDAQKFPLSRDSARNDFRYVIASIATPPEVKEDVLPPAPPEKPDDTVDNNLKVRIRLVDKKRRPLAYTRVRVDLKKGFEVTDTDADGVIFIERKAFTQGEKVHIKVLPESPDKIKAPAPQPKAQPAVPAPPRPAKPAPVPPAPPAPSASKPKKPTPPPIPGK